jgi:hypothetical protein
MYDLIIELGQTPLRDCSTNIKPPLHGANGDFEMTYSDEQQEMIARSFASRDGSMEWPDIQLEKERSESQARENRNAMKFRSAPYSNPSANAGEDALREINNALIAAIEAGESQYTKAIFRGTFEDIESHLENVGCEYGAWSYLEEWFLNFAIAAGIGSPELEDLDAPGSDKLSLCFSWVA